MKPKYINPPKNENMVMKWRESVSSELNVTVKTGTFTAATGLGSVCGVVELFDIAGNSKGYIPVYDSYS